MLEKLYFPKISLSKLRKGVAIFIIAAGIFSAGYVLGYKGFRASIDTEDPYEVVIERELPGGKKDLDFSLFWRVWDTLETKYFDKSKLVKSQMVYGAIQGMVSSIGDPYTVFLPPGENKIVQEDLQGAFEGVGIRIGFKGTQLAIISPLPDSPAEKAGVKAGDFILRIKDEKRGIDLGTAGISLQEAVQAIRGEAGTTVVLTLLREGNEEPFEIGIVRETIDVPSIRYSYVGEKEDVIHVKILKFSGETFDEWEEVVIAVLKKPETSGIILDLRNNPGGYLQGAVDLASEFLDIGTPVVKEEGSEGLTEEYKVERLGRFKNLKTVVLVNGGSASASEILAGALRDEANIQLVGETTFGKGTIQEPQQVDDGSGLHVTIARWLTPSGFWVNEGGLVPDVEVKDNLETEEDEQLQEAIELIGSVK